MQNGFLLEQLNVEWGCRQGYPVSPYIFLLCAEVLAILLKNNKDIKGIVINDKDHIISQFADDTTLILDSSRKSLISALENLAQVQYKQKVVPVYWRNDSLFLRKLYM